MLQSIRELSKSWLFKGLMSLLVISFGIWGVGDMFKTHPGQREVARVGKEKIPVQMLDLRFRIALPEARQVFGPDLTIEQAKQIGVMDRTLNLMMQESAFDQEANRLGLKLDDAIVFRRIAKMPHFQDKSGSFNVQAWQDLIGRSGLTERLFIDQEKGGMIRTLLFKTMIANTTPPQTLIDNMYRARGAKRILEVVALKNDSLKSIPTPSDADLDAYRGEHEELFTAPEYRGLTIARLLAQDVEKDVAISEEDVKKAYETRGDELVLPETRDLIQVVLQDEDKAKALYEAAKSSKSLSDSAKTKGLSAVALNKVDDKTILPELYTTAFGLTIGEVAEPVKSPMGWHVMQVKAVHQGGKPTFDQVKDELKKTLHEERVGDLLARSINQLDDLLAEGKTLEDVADSLKLHLTRYPFVDAQGKGADGKPIKNMVSPDNVVRAAFDLGAGETGQVMNDKEGNYFVVRTDQISPSRVMPLGEVRTKVLEALMNEKQAAEAAKAIEEMAQDIRDGAKATSFASRPGVEVNLSKPISVLGDMDKSLPQTAMSQVFKMKKGDVITAADKEKAYALRLVDIVPVDPRKPEASRVKIVDDLKDRIRLDYMEHYTSRLHTLFPERINESLLAQLKNQETPEGR